MPVLGAERVYSDVDQGLVTTLVFLVILTAVLIFAAYLEPGSEAKPLRMRQRLARLLAPRSEHRG